MPEPRIKRIVTRVTVAEHRELTTAACKAGVSVVEYCRLKLGLAPIDPKIKQNQRRGLFKQPSPV